MDTKQGKMLTYSERLPSLKPLDPVTNGKSRDNLKNLNLPVSLGGRI